MKTLSDPSVRAALLERIERLRPDAKGRWGRMSVDQMLRHLNEGLRSALGQADAAPTHTAFTRTVTKWVALLGPWPKGKIATNPEMVVSGEYDFEEEGRELRRLIEEVGARDPGGDWPLNSVFGPFNGWQWSRLEFRHVDHHLRQFGA